MKKLGLITLALSALLALPAHALLLTNSAGPFTSTAGATTFATFDTPTLTGIGSVSGGHANYGDNPGPGNWLAVDDLPGGSVPIVVNLTGMATYFGFLWGPERDAQNTIFLVRNTPGGSVDVGEFTGLTPVSGTGTFFNITATSPAEQFNQIIFARGFPVIFEVDNFAATLATVPVPGSLALLGLGAGLGFLRRRTV